MEKKYLRYLSNYVAGLVNMASSCSKTMGPSYVDADCFSRENFEDEFANLYNVNKDEIKLTEINKSFRDVLSDLFGTDTYGLIDGLEHWIHMKAGDSIKLYRISEDCRLSELLSGDNGGCGAFFFMEDIFFFEFEKMVICFMIGNDE